MVTCNNRSLLPWMTLLAAAITCLTACTPKISRGETFVVETEEVTAIDLAASEPYRCLLLDGCRLKVTGTFEDDGKQYVVAEYRCAERSRPYTDRWSYCNDTDVLVEAKTFADARQESLAAAAAKQKKDALLNKARSILTDVNRIK